MLHLPHCPGGPPIPPPQGYPKSAFWSVFLYILLCPLKFVQLPLPQSFPALSCPCYVVWRGKLPRQVSLSWVPCSSLKLPRNCPLLPGYSLAIFVYRCLFVSFSVQSSNPDLATLSFSLLCRFDKMIQAPLSTS